MRIGICGLGKLGLPLSLVFAEAEHEVFAYDKNPDLIKSLKKGFSPIQERQVQEMLQDVNMDITFDDKPEILKKSSIIFIIVPTPSKPEGEFNNDYIEEALKEMPKNIPIVICSTVMPGTCQTLVKENRPIIYNPLFIALGDVVQNLKQPDYVLIGQSDPIVGNAVKDIWREVIGVGRPIHQMDLVSAEITKLATNVYITQKISFANILGELSENLGADVDAITQAMGEDKRIGHVYLKSGLAFGGPCFPRDNRAFHQVCLKAGKVLNYSWLTDKINSFQAARIVSRIPEKSKVAILGMSYKPRTPSMDESESVKINKLLKGMNCEVSTWDEFYPGSIKRALENAEYVILCHPGIDLEDLIKPKMHVIDCWRAYPHLKLKCKYEALGCK